MRLLLVVVMGYAVAACASLFGATKAVQQTSEDVLTFAEGQCLVTHANESPQVAQEACGIAPAKQAAAQTFVTCAAPVVASPPDPRSVDAGADAWEALAVKLNDAGGAAGADR